VSLGRAPLGPHASTPAELQAQIEADRQGHPYLLFHDGHGRQRIVPLGEAGLRHTVGRAATAEICLDWDDQVSRVHAEIEALSGSWTVVDDGLSRNGTFVNEEPVSGRRRLRGGDTLRFGSTRIAFRSPNRTLGETVDAGRGAAPRLTEAQRRVLIELCRPCAGRAGPAAPATNRQIADRLFLSVEGVKTHVRTLFQRFGVEDLPQNAKRARLVELAFASGAVVPRDFER
jgi:pSer/pThr/pTyr-binding forkhead associated (FHA) protein